MIISAAEVKRRLDQNEGLIIDPYCIESQQPASYDLRVGSDHLLLRGRVSLVHSLERVELPADLAATLRCRSSYARKGILLGGGFVDPGFRGQLTLCLVNMGGEDLQLHSGDRVVQMILYQVLEGGTLYDGQYQDSKGAVVAR